jgi:hypothetical protein
VSTHHAERGDDDEAERAVDDERVQGDERETDEARDQADLQLLRAEGRRDGSSLHLEAERQRAVLQLVGERLGALLVKEPLICGLPSRMTPFMDGAEMTAPSRTKANWFCGARL